MSAKNIVLFGETGAGKSSVVNLMAGREVATTSPNRKRCTMHWQEHVITFGEYNYKVFDTAGLDEPRPSRMNQYLEVVEDAYRMIAKLQNDGGIDLLVFCVRAGIVTAATQTNYRLFYEWLCEQRVPIVLVLTGLEKEQRMEDWWTTNEHIFQHYRIKVAGHACITAANSLDEEYEQLYEESRRLVRDLVIEHTHGREGRFSTRFRWLLVMLKELGNNNPKKKDIVTVLNKRCGIPLEVARQLASQLEVRESPQSTPLITQ